MIRPTELGRAREERADGREDRDGEKPGRRISLYATRPDHYGQQGANDLPAFCGPIVIGGWR